LVANDATPEPRTIRFLEELKDRGALRHRLVHLEHHVNVGFVRNVQAAFDALADADVVILNSDCMVGPEWLGRLCDAAYCDSTVATATALTNHGTILSVPERNTPSARIPEHLDIDAVARLIAVRSNRLRPRIPTAIGHCVYVRRDALELVGGFDDAFSPGYGEEVDFSQRCLARGLLHVAADDVFVFHRGTGSFEKPSQIQIEHERLVRARHPCYHDTVKFVEQQKTGPLVRALETASGCAVVAAPACRAGGARD